MREGEDAATWLHITPQLKEVVGHSILSPARATAPHTDTKNVRSFTARASSLTPFTMGRVVCERDKWRGEEIDDGAGEPGTADKAVSCYPPPCQKCVFHPVVSISAGGGGVGLYNPSRPRPVSSMCSRGEGRGWHRGASPGRETRGGESTGQGAAPLRPAWLLASWHASLPLRRLPEGAPSPLLATCLSRHILRALGVVKPRCPLCGSSCCRLLRF